MLEIDMDRLNRVNFRACLNALSRPGSRQALSLFKDSGLLAMASQMLYSEVGYSYDGKLDFNLIEALTGASKSNKREADFIFADQPSVTLLKAAKTGDQENPEQSACLIFAVESLDEGTGAILQGPGIDGRLSTILPATEEFIKVLQQKNSNFPCGVEIFFVSPGGGLLALSRTTRIEKTV